MNFRTLALATLSASIVLPYAASQTAAPTLAASALTAVPPLIPYSGQVEGRTGETSATFLIYKDQQGGEPLFAETQTVTPDRFGQYKVQLGASLSNGIPIDLFASGEARWLEVQIAGEAPQPRVLLVSVPYALKAADAATLGGLPASAYALAGSKTVGSTVTPAITPDGVTTVTTTGGVSGHVAEFSGASAIADSSLFVLGADVGIGTTTPTATLDVNGSALISGALSANGGETVNGMLELASTGTATAASGFNSQLLKLYSSAYNSTSKGAVNPRFEWQAVAHGNNTTSPSATLDLLSSTGSASATYTGFSFNANGTINFAPGQTFPGTGKITSVGLSAPSSDFSVSGSPVTGAGNLGLNWNVAPTPDDNPNAIVKRDASGNFTAGSILASLGVEGITSVGNGNGVAGIHNGGGIAVLGESFDAGGVGVYGSRGDGLWRSSYVLQGDQKRAQIDQMIRFAESNQCRMMSLVRHFGDTSDDAMACGACDFCAPAKCVAQRFRTATEGERTTLYRVLRGMRSVFTKSTGKLYTELYPGNEISRDNFEEVLGAMARAELLTFADAVFEKQGKQIPYRTVRLTPVGRAVDESVPVLFVMKDAARPVPKRKRKKNSSKSKAASGATARTQSGQARTGAAVPEPKIRIEQALRAWRLSEARHRKIPAFRVFGDRALRGIAAVCPRSDAELLAVPGIGMSIVKKYGTQIYRLVAGSS